VHFVDIVMPRFVRSTKCTLCITFRRARGGRHGESDEMHPRPQLERQHDRLGSRRRSRLCDAYHCSVFGSTNPNRNYLVSGTTGYEPGSTARAVTNAAYDYDHLGYDWTTYAERLELPLHVDVAREHRERLALTGDAYRLAVQGPNRFLYEFAGAAARIDVRARAVPFRAVLALELDNDGEETVTWDTDHGWYDVEVTAEEDRAFRRRLTGRVENGRTGVSG
jgi:hypothetical protein